MVIEELKVYSKKTPWNCTTLQGDREQKSECQWCECVALDRLSEEFSMRTAQLPTVPAVMAPFPSTHRSLLHTSQWYIMYQQHDQLSIMFQKSCKITFYAMFFLSDFIQLFNVNLKFVSKEYTHFFAT